MITLLSLGAIFAHQAQAGEDNVDLYLTQSKSTKSAKLEDVRTFTSVFQDLKSDMLAQRVKEAYAEELYFNDTLVTLFNRNDLVTYLQQSGAKTNYVKTTILDAVRSGDDVYVRWLLEMEFDVLGSARKSRTVGMSHLRMDQSEKIVLHQDFWDSADGIYKHIPVISSLISWVSGRLHTQPGSADENASVSDKSFSPSTGR